MLASIIFLIGYTCQIAIGKETIQVEVADTPELRAKGLMGRKSLSEGEGMLFVFETPQLLVFWMKNMEIPLSIAFFDKTKKLIDVFNMSIPAQTSGPFPLFESSRPALYALEVQKNWFQNRRIERGTEFSFLDQSNGLEWPE